MLRKLNAAHLGRASWNRKAALFSTAAFLAAFGTSSALAAQDDAQVISNFLIHLNKIQNIRVEYTESRTLTPPGVEPLVPTTQRSNMLPPNAIGKVLQGRFDSECVFGQANKTHCFYDREFSNETIERLTKEEIDFDRYLYLFYVGDSVTRFVIRPDGTTDRFFFEKLARPIYPGIDVALGLRLQGDNQAIDKERLAKATVTRNDDGINIEVPGTGGSTHVITVDPKKNWAIVRFAIKVDQQIIEEDISDQFDEVQPGLFLPKHVVMHSYYDLGKGRRESHRCEFTVKRYTVGREPLQWYQDHPVDPPRIIKGVSTAPAAASDTASTPSAKKTVTPDETKIAAAAAPNPAPSVPAEATPQKLLGLLRKKGSVLFEEEFNVGKVTPSQEIKHDFALVNLSNSKLKIEKVTATCNCTIATVPEMELAANGVMRIPISVKLAEGVKGEFEEKVLVQFQDAGVGSIVITIRGALWSAESEQSPK